MKKNRWLLLALGLFLLAGMLYTCTRGESGPEQLASMAARTALENFSRYQETGEESTYWQGAGFFREFQQHCQEMGAEDHLGLGPVAGDIYRAMNADPAAARAHMDKLIEALTALSRTLNDEAGYRALLEYRDLVAGKDQ